MIRFYFFSFKGIEIESDSTQYEHGFRIQMLAHKIGPEKMKRYQGKTVFESLLYPSGVNELQKFVIYISSPEKEIKHTQQHHLKDERFRKSLHRKL